MNARLISKNCGDLFLMADFVRDVKAGCLTDYDGYGVYSDGVYQFETIVNLKKIDRKYSHVIWFNK